jgi:hypothetical protein
VPGNSTDGRSFEGIIVAFAGTLGCEKWLSGVVASTPPIVILPSNISIQGLRGPKERLFWP